MNADIASEIQELKDAAVKAKLPDSLMIKINRMFVELERSVNATNFFETSERIRHYIEWITKIPWNIKKSKPINLQEAKQILDGHHYGLEDLKTRLLEYLAVVKLNEDRGGDDTLRSPVLLLVGQAGTGKTTFAKAIADATGRELVRLPFGGLGSARDLRGQSRLHLEAEPGNVIKGLIRAQSSNPVILLDEIDRVADEARADIMGVLLELLDPEQNNAFVDYYIDFPVDLSRSLFIATCNNTGHIATAVMDRLEPIMMPAYNDQEKLMIAKNYLLPRALKEANMNPAVIQIDEVVWPQIIRPLGYDSGIRTLHRTIAGIVRKVAKQSLEENIPSIHITTENIEPYLPSFRTELL